MCGWWTEGLLLFFFFFCLFKKLDPGLRIQILKINLMIAPVQPNHDNGNHKPTDTLHALPPFTQALKLPSGTSENS
jgi:hypothetical protein